MAVFDGFGTDCHCVSILISEIQLKDTEWQYEDELALLRDDLKLIADQCRVDETKKMVNAIEVRRAIPLTHTCMIAEYRLFCSGVSGSSLPSQWRLGWRSRIPRCGTIS